MAKSILISIKPRYVADILNHKKTIEVRKSIPKCDLPIDVYIYCTKDKTFLFKDLFVEKGGEGKLFYIDTKEHDDWSQKVNGKVVAKFTLNKVEEIKFDDKEIQKKACLTEDELFDYLFVNIPYQEDMRKGYAWHISNLKIFDEPKYLCDFWNTKKGVFCCPLTKAPQNMCYIETGK